MDRGRKEGRWRPRTFRPALASGAGHAAVVVGLLFSAARSQPGELGRIPSAGDLELREAPSLELARPNAPGPGKNERVEARSVDSPSKTSAPLPIHATARASAPVADRRAGDDPGRTGAPTLPGTDGEPGADDATEAALAADAGAAPTAVAEDVLARAAGGNGASGAGGHDRSRALVPPSMDRSRGPIPPPLDRALESLYPVEAQRAHVGGMARVRVLVRRDGSVGSVARVSESRDGFGSACEETMKVSGSWKAAVDTEGVPVDEDALVTCRFVLPDQR